MPCRGRDGSHRLAVCGLLRSAPLPVLAETVHELARQLGEVQERAATPRPMPRLRQRLAHVEQAAEDNRSSDADPPDGRPVPDLTERHVAVWLAANRQYLRTLPGTAAARGPRAPAWRVAVQWSPPPISPMATPALSRELTAMDDWDVVVVEIPAGSRNKYEADHETGEIFLDRRLFTATAYPTDYGYFPDTLADDGDPLDALVLLTEPTFPGCRIRARAIGVFWMEDEKGDDAKVVCVP